MNATLFDGRSALGIAVQAAVAGPHLALTPEEGAPVAAWPLRDLRRCDGGGGGSAVFQRGGAERLAVTDAGLLADLRAAGVDFADEAHWGPRRWGMFAAGCLASIAVCALLIDRLPALVAPLVPRALEHGWSSTIETAIAAETPRCTSPAGMQALHALLARLGNAAGIEKTPALTVLDANTVNAFTLPDGRILVLRGLIDRADSPDELAGVLAHELGHVRRHDPTREMLRQLALNMVAQNLGWGSAVAGNMAALSYGRRAEAAADASAVTTLRAAGLRPDGLRRFFLSLRNEMPDEALPFLSDHPATAQRLAALPADTRGAAALDAKAWEAVKHICEPPRLSGQVLNQR